MMKSYFANKLGMGNGDKRQRGRGAEGKNLLQLLSYSLLPTPFIRRFMVRRMYASTGSVVGLKISA